MHITKKCSCGRRGGRGRDVGGFMGVIMGMEAPTWLPTAWIAAGTAAGAVAVAAPLLQLQQMLLQQHDIGWNLGRK